MPSINLFIYLIHLIHNYKTISPSIRTRFPKFTLFAQLYTSLPTKNCSCFLWRLFIYLCNYSSKFQDRLGITQARFLFTAAPYLRFDGGHEGSPTRILQNSIQNLQKEELGKELCHVKHKLHLFFKVHAVKRACYSYSPRKGIKV